MVRSALRRRLGVRVAAGQQVRLGLALSGGTSRVVSHVGVIKALVLENAGDYSRSQLDKLNGKAREWGGKGVIWIKRTDEFKSSLKLPPE